MKISILTLFPEMFEPLKCSIIDRAVKRDVFSIDVIDIRKFSNEKHGKCDDEPFGGGAGMVMTPQPIFDAINAVDSDHKALRVYMSPKGARLDNCIVKEFAAMQSDLVVLCGHYEGVDQRVIDLCIDREISIGDYVLTGGELAAMVFVDAVSRFIPGTIKAESAQGDTFESGLLEYPQYTRPQEFMVSEFLTYCLAVTMQMSKNGEESNPLPLRKNFGPIYWRKDNEHTLVSRTHDEIASHDGGEC